MIMFSCLNYIVFVPMLYTLVLIVKCYAFSLSTTLLCPLLDFISLMQFPCFVALVECWTCKWFFALNLLACMSGCSFLVWMIIVVTIYSDCTFFGQAMVYWLFHFAWSYCACSYALQVFCIQWSYCVVVFQEMLVLMVQELHRF